MARTSKLVAYYRTSTDDQRLGIDAQRTTLARIATDRQGDVVREYVEHESGGDNERAELDKAIKHSRRIGATLVVAKLDRLSRDSIFLQTLYAGDVPIIFGDLPEIDGSAASRFMVQVMAAMAEFERKRIGERTKEALAVLKAQGIKLGTPRNLTQSGRIKGSLKSASRSHRKAISDMADVASIAVGMRNSGATLKGIADHLNAEGHSTRKGCEWTAAQVLRVILRVPRT